MVAPARWLRAPPALLLTVVAPVLRTLAVRILPAAVSWRARCRRAGASRRLAVQRGDVDVQAFAQPVGAVDDHMIAGRQPGVDGSHAAVRGTDGDRPHRYGVVGVDQVDVGALLPVRRAALDRNRRYRDDIGQGPDQEHRVDELVRKQRAVGVVELGADFYRARGGVDLAVDGRHFADCQLFDIGAIESGDL